MLYIIKRVPFNRLYCCECGRMDCSQCTRGTYSGVVKVEDIYSLIRNPPPMPPGEDLIYVYE